MRFSRLQQGGRALRLMLACLLAAALVGCGSSGPSDTLSGKVTLNGQPVNGMVVLTGADGKTAQSMISPDGVYIVVNPPKGECSVLVKGMPGMPMSAPTAPKDAGGKMPGVSESKIGVPPPAKYAQANNGLAKVNITGGKQTHNIELTP